MRDFSDGTSKTILIAEGNSTGYKPLSDSWMKNNVGIPRLTNVEGVFYSGHRRAQRWWPFSFEGSDRCLLRASARYLDGSLVERRSAE